MRRLLNYLIIAVICISFCLTAFATDGDVVIADTDKEVSTTTTTTTSTTTTTTTADENTDVAEDTDNTEDTDNNEKSSSTTTTTTTSKTTTTTKRPTVAVQNTPTKTTTTTTSKTTTTTTSSETDSESDTDTDSESEELSDYVFVSAIELEAAKLTGKDLEFSGTNSAFDYKWSIKSASITSIDKDVVLTVSDNGANASKIRAILPENSNYAILGFDHNGKLPFSADLSVSGLSVPDGNYYLYYFDKGISNGVYTGDVQVTDGVLNLKLSDCNNYFITDKMLPVYENEGMDSYVKLLIEVAIAIVIAIILGLIVSKIRGKVSDKKEETEDVKENQIESNPDDFIITKDYKDFEYVGDVDVELDDEVLVPDEDDEEIINQILREIPADEEDFLLFNDEDKLDVPEYGYGYGPTDDEIVIAVEDDDDDDYDSEYIDQTNSDGLILEGDDVSEFEYSDYNDNYTVEDESTYGMVFDDELIFEEDDDDDEPKKKNKKKKK